MATFATQPVLCENFLNGRSVLRFDGTNYLDADFSWLANTDYTVIAVEGRRSNKSSNYFLLNSGGNSSNRNGHFGYRQNGTYTLAQYGNDLDSGIAGYSQQVFRAWTHWFDDDVGHMIYLNGDSFASNSNKAGFTQVNQGKIGRQFLFLLRRYCRDHCLRIRLAQGKVEQVHEYLALK